MYTHLGFLYMSIVSLFVIASFTWRHVYKCAAALLINRDV